MAYPSILRDPLFPYSPIYTGNFPSPLMAILAKRGYDTLWFLLIYFKIRNFLSCLFQMPKEQKFRGYLFWDPLTERLLQ